MPVQHPVPKHDSWFLTGMPHMPVLGMVRLAYAFLGFSQPAVALAALVRSKCSI